MIYLQRKLIYILLTILFTFSSALPTLATTNATAIQGLSQGQVITVSHINVINVTTPAGTAPVLPSTGTATMSDGTTKTVNITWGSMASKYFSEGTFIVIGSITESTTIKAIATVTVTELNPVTTLTTEQIQQGLVGTWKTSDGIYTLEFHNDGILKETESHNGYSAMNKYNYSFSNPTRIRIASSSWTEDDNIVFNEKQLQITKMGIIRHTGNSSNFSNFSIFGNFSNYLFIKVD